MIKKLLEDGFNSIQLDLDKREEAKKGTLRGGSTGCLVDGNFFGECPRLAQRRYAGLSHSISFESDLVFNLGFSHENNVLSKLLINDSVKAVSIPEGQFSFNINHPKLTVGCHLQLDINGYNWSGSPDFVVDMVDGTRFGLETKALASSSSASKIWEGDSPYTKALLQSAMYSYVMQIPWYICYGLYFYSGSYKNKINPFIKEFKVVMEGEQNQIGIVRESGEKVMTDFSIDGILDFYRAVASSKEVLPRPLEKEMFNTYSRCDYCSCRDICQEYDLSIINDEEFLLGK